MASFRIEAEREEGATIRSLFRATAGGVILPALGADSLLVEVFQSGNLVWSKVEIPVVQLTDLKTGPGWSKQGSFNFEYAFDPVALAAESPSFTFKGGKTYLIRYTLNRPTGGPVVLIDEARIRPA